MEICKSLYPQHINFIIFKFFLSQCGDLLNFLIAFLKSCQFSFLLQKTKKCEDSAPLHIIKSEVKLKT